MSSVPLTDDELRFYYTGFYTVLKRYRTMTVLGWFVVAVGLVSFMLAWNAGREHAIVDTMLACACAVSGLALVQNSVASLSSYVAVPCTPAGSEVEGAEKSPVVLEIVAVMKDVEEGGWQEAYAAMKKLKEMESKYGLPPLNH